MRSKFFNIFLSLIIISLLLKPNLDQSNAPEKADSLVLAQTGYQSATLYIFVDDQPIATLGGRYQFESCQESDKFTNKLSIQDIYKDYKDFDQEYKGEILSSSVKSRNNQSTMLLGSFAPFFAISKSPGFCSMIKSIPDAVELLPDQYYRYTQDFLKERFSSDDEGLLKDSLEFYQNARFKFVLSDGNLVEISGYDKSNLSRTINTIRFSKIEL